MSVHKLFSPTLEIDLNRGHSANRRFTFTLTRTGLHMNIPAYNCILLDIMSWMLIHQWCLKCWYFLMYWHGPTLKKPLLLNHIFNLAWTRGELDHLNNSQLLWATGWMIGASRPCRGWEFFYSPPCPDQLRSPPSLLQYENLGLFHRG